MLIAWQPRRSWRKNGRSASAILPYIYLRNHQHIQIYFEQRSAKRREQVSSDNLRTDWPGDTALPHPQIPLVSSCHPQAYQVGKEPNLPNSRFHAFHGIILQWDPSLPHPSIRRQCTMSLQPDKQCRIQLLNLQYGFQVTGEEVCTSKVDVNVVSRQWNTRRCGGQSSNCGSNPHIGRC